MKAVNRSPKLFEWSKISPIGFYRGKPKSIDGYKERKEYPNDRATGYSLGEIRGAISITATISHEAKR